MQTRRCRAAPASTPSAQSGVCRPIHRQPQRLWHLCRSVMSELPLQASPRALTERPSTQFLPGTVCPHQDLNLGCRGHNATS